MNLDLLRAFVLVAHNLSFNKAAGLLFISQAAVSKQIAELEKQLGVQLFIREYHKLQLTSEGAELLKECKEVMGTIDRILNKHSVPRGGARKLVIGCVENEYTFFPQVIKMIRERLPDVFLDVKVLPPREIEGAVDCDELDIGIRPFFSTGPKTKLSCKELYTARMCFVLPREHSYARNRVLDIAALGKERFLVLDPSVYDEHSWFIDYCSKRKFRPNITNQVLRVDELFWQVAAGIGISVLGFNPNFYRILRQTLAFVTMEGEDAYMKLGAVWKAQNTNPVIPQLISIISEAYDS